MISDDALIRMKMATRIVAAYVRHNNASPEALLLLLHQTHHALGDGPEPAGAGADDVVGRSITPDFLYSFENGQPYRSLRRHLGVRGLTPASYRQKHGLPADYPMVAETYSAMRSRLSGWSFRRDRSAKDRASENNSIQQTHLTEKPG